MSQRNEDQSGIAFAGAAIGIAALFFFAVLAFAAVVLTILAFAAWNSPLTIGKNTVQPHEARAFVARGVIGAITLPVFMLFCAALFKLKIHPEAWGYVLLGGYTLGSVVYEMMTAEDKDNTAPTVEILPPPAPPPAPPKQEKEEVAFTFASWNDEEARK